MASAGRMVLRLVVGGLFMGHGLQKLKGWFGGPGLEGTDKMMAATQMYPVRRNAIAAGATEAVGGALVAAGAYTPVAAAGLIGVMTTAIRKVHAKNGLWNGKGGYEFNLALIASLVALAADGPGAGSIDDARGRRHGLRWGIFALVGGIAGSAVAVELGKRGAAE